MSKTKEILGPLAKLMRRGFRGQKIPVANGLETVLSELEKGNTEALKDLPAEVKTAVCNLLADAVEEAYGKNLAVGAAVESLRGGNYKDGVEGLFAATPVNNPEGLPIYGPRFFARDPAAVAKDLCGSGLLYAKGSDVWAGVVKETGAYRGATKKDKATAEAMPGTMGVWSAQGYKILIVSAHDPGKKGTVAVWGLSFPGEAWGMGDVGAQLDIESMEGKVVGDPNSGLIVMPRDPSTDSVGMLYVRSTNKVKGSSASYKLSR